MASVEEVKQMMYSAAEMIVNTGGYMNAAQLDVNQAQEMLMRAADGSNNVELVQLQARAEEIAIKFDDLMLDCLGLSTQIKDATNFL